MFTLLRDIHHSYRICVHAALRFFLQALHSVLLCSWQSQSAQPLDRTGATSHRTWCRKTPQSSSSQAGRRCLGKHLQLNCPCMQVVFLPDMLSADTPFLPEMTTAIFWTAGESLIMFHCQWSQPPQPPQVSPRLWSLEGAGSSL